MSAKSNKPSYTFFFHAVYYVYDTSFCTSFDFFQFVLHHYIHPTVFIRRNDFDNTFEQFATHFCAMAVERGSAIPAVSAQGEAIASVLSFGLDVRTSAEPFYTDN